ncbi:MAG: type II CRISPR-associated endonuclease Cas1 [Lachnospiraceae bacterium]|nr:type II CRISPR-associated endonuclease Cas1 [Lachnospiraceae bacterium]
MSFRTIAITKRAKLNLTMGFLEIRGENTTKVFLDDIDIILIENQAVSMTAALLTELMKRKIKVILCDGKRNPQAEMIPYYGSGDSSRKIKCQIAWSDSIKEKIWTSIVREKIKNQSLFLKELEKKREQELLESYIEELTEGDKTNREGLAAKVYFNALFGMGFKREEETPINAALDYGYSILLSTVNKEIAYNGYITQLGLFHDNIYNPFNLASDLMEPFRILVDRMVYEKKPEQFETEEKHEMLHLLEKEIIVGNNRQVFTNGVRIYVRSVFDALCDENVREILFYTL